jgi:hypothetical protein
MSSLPIVLVVDIIGHPQKEGEEAPSAPMSTSPATPQHLSLTSTFTSTHLHAPDKCPLPLQSSSPLRQ